MHPKGEAVTLQDALNIVVPPHYIRVSCASNRDPESYELGSKRTYEPSLINLDSIQFGQKPESFPYTVFLPPKRANNFPRMSATLSSTFHGVRGATTLRS